MIRVEKKRYACVSGEIDSWRNKNENMDRKSLELTKCSELNYLI